MSITKKYSSQFKQEALVLSDEIKLKEATRKQGLPYSTLSCWRKTINRYSPPK